MYGKFKIHEKPGTVMREPKGLSLGPTPILHSSWRDMDVDIINAATNKMQLWTEQEGVFAFPSEDQEAPCLGWMVEIEEGQFIIEDWNDLSRNGLLYALNVCVFHPQGFAVTRNPANGESPTIIYDNIDHMWEFSDADHVEGRDKLANFGFVIPELFINDRV